MVSPFLPEAEKVAAVRAALPSTRAALQFNAGSCGPLPAETQRAIDEQAAVELTYGRSDPERWPEVARRLDEARAGVAAVLVADPADVALTHSTSEGLALAIGALPWRPGDRVVTTDHEHPGGLGPLRSLRDRAGIELEVVAIGDGGDADAVVAAIGAALERPARALLVSHVLWTNGAVLPAARLAAVARERGVVAVVDGAQAAGAIPVVLEELGADAYAVPGQKWLLGPEGTGALWVRRSLADELAPAAAGPWSYADPASGALRPGAGRLEPGGFHVPSVVGLARSLGWLSMYVGLPWAIERAGRMAASLHGRLSAIPGVRVLTPAAALGTIVAFRIEGWDAAAALAEVAPRASAVLRTVPPLGAIRASAGWWTTDEELDRLVGVVELVARHAPGTLPPRRRLEVLGSDGSPLR